jgi:hypothetical protein
LEHCHHGGHLKGGWVSVFVQNPSHYDFVSIAENIIEVQLRESSGNPVFWLRSE